MQVFRQLHHLYVDMVSNPFYLFGQPLNSASFNMSIHTLINNSNL